MKEMEDSLCQSFGKHYIDSIAKGQVPPQLMIDGTHFTTLGYKEIATLVYLKMKELGY